MKKKREGKSLKQCRKELPGKVADYTRGDLHHICAGMSNKRYLEVLVELMVQLATEYRCIKEDMES